MKTIKDYEGAVELLKEHIDYVTKNVKFRIEDTTTNNYKTFKMETLKRGYIVVSREGCDNTIYRDRFYNIKARVWHDLVHLEHDLDFSPESEDKVCDYQKEGLTEWFKAFKIDTDKSVLHNAISVLHHDIVGQSEYYDRYGEFVVHQESFVQNLFFNRS